MSMQGQPPEQQTRAVTSAHSWVLEEVCVLLAAPPEAVLELIEYRHSVSTSPELPSHIDEQLLNWLRRGLRLQRDLGIDALAAALIAELLDRNAALEQRVRLLERLAMHGF